MSHYLFIQSFCD